MQADRRAEKGRRAEQPEQPEQPEEREQPEQYEYECECARSGLCVLAVCWTESARMQADNQAEKGEEAA